MRQIADLHIHSRFSRACSKDLTLTNLDKTCRTKGIDIIGTGDFTYPAWFKEFEEELEEIENSGFYKLKKAEDKNIKFVLTTELALVYKKYDKARRIHLVVQAPNLESVAELNQYLDKRYNIRSDGRPILGMKTEELMEVCLKINPKFLVYPAHIWTPWFAVFGSKSGFDKLEDCFGEYTKDIHAYETGLSSDPAMNWRLSALDHLTLLSNSDAHSLPNLGREANVFNLEKITYNELYNVIASPKTEALPAARRESRDESNKDGIATPAARNDKASYLDYTIEFYPEEGMYHYDGHRDCGVRYTPVETKKHKGICHKCKKPVVVGVEYRVDELADRPIGFKPANKPGFKKLVELDKVIAESIGVRSRSSKKVQEVYVALTTSLGSELDILMNTPISDIVSASSAEIGEGVRRVRAGELSVDPGFDGQYGVVRIFKDEEKVNSKQKKLFV
jgi:PHP family Zn ribbon phosphoesterase